MRALNPNKLDRAVADAQALVANPATALAAGASARRAAWCILKSARGQTCIQIHQIRDAQTRGVR